MAKNNNKKSVKPDRAQVKVDRRTKQQKIKNAQIANKNRQKNDESAPRGGLKEYFKGVKVETKKVVWPTRQELVSYTVVVVFTCALFAVALWGVDSGFLALLKLLFNISM